MIWAMTTAPGLRWVWLLLLWVTSAFQRCIFDDIQSSVRVVAPSPGGSAPASDTITIYSDKLSSAPKFSLPFQLSWPIGKTVPQRAVSNGLGRTSPQHTASNGLGRTSPQHTASNSLGRTSPQRAVSNGLGRTSPQHTASNGLGRTSPQNTASNSLGRTSPQRAASNGLGRTVPQRAASNGLGRIKRQLAQTTEPLALTDPSGLLPIRIKVWIPQESPALSQEEKERLIPAVDEAVGTVSNILSVNRVPGRLLLSRDVFKYCRFIWKNTSAVNYNNKASELISSLFRCGGANKIYRMETCLDVIIPDDHLGGYGVYPHPDVPMLTVLKAEGPGLPETDFVLYLHTQSTDKCREEPSIRAYAVHCQTDQHGRPLAGVAVICRDRLIQEGYSHKRAVQMLIHELFHMLGFSRELFNTWRDCSYSHQSAIGCLLRGHVTNTDEAGQVRIYTQSIIKSIQAHLGSSHSELGGPLENWGARVRGLSSHWEARVLQGSIMAAVLGDPELVRIDPVTLAALQDTGWYQVNHSSAQNLEWGEGQGALFGSLSTCHDNTSSFFCTGSGFGCHYLHLHKGVCQSDPYLEGCRIYKPLSQCWKEENEREDGVEEWSGEIYHSDSRCFFSNLSREELSVAPTQLVVGRCYRHRCTGMNQYQIQVSGSHWVDCPAGTSLQVSGYRGLVFCPDNRLCRDFDYSSPRNNTTPPSSFFTQRAPHLRDVSLVPGRNFDPLLSSTVTSALGGVASLSLLIALLIGLSLGYRRFCSSSLRVHPVPETPSVLQLYTLPHPATPCP